MAPTSNVDAIWEAMKAESSGVSSSELARSLKSLSLKGQKSCKEKTTSKESLRGLNAIAIPKGEQITTMLTSDDIADKMQDTNATEAVVLLKDSILWWSHESPAQALALGDSDDDDDNDDDTETDGSSSSRQEPNRGWRMDRFISAIQSTDVVARLEGLTALCMAVEELLSTLGNAPPLDFPPPYDKARITLTHRTMGGVVSDMSNDWAQWERTHAPVMSQFRKECKLNAAEVAASDEMQGEVDARAQLQAILDGCGCALFRRYGDQSEKCRSLAIRCTQALCLAGVDMGKHAAYLIPAVLSRHPTVAFDPETQVFVHNVDDHEHHKRGGATERQDRDGLISSKGSHITLLEPSEEIRLALCDLISSLVRGAVGRQSLGAIDAYLADIVLALQSNLRDPFPELKVRSAKVLVQLLRIPQWEAGAKYFALGLARAAITNMRHRNSKVRIAAIDLFEASVSVPNREKIKGAGSDAIADLVGFREENVLPIAAFYNAACGVTVNTLAELAIDKNSRVRDRCCEMLSFFMVCLPDRYDHQVRLLPYLLSFYRDQVSTIRQRAMEAVDNCGEQYEAEHPDEIIERRQFGIDGNSKCNHSDLPYPFESRPRLGARLFVRNNSKRFFTALLSELTSWVSKTREQSAELLSILLVYCEEHITMDLHQTLPLVVKALQRAQSEVEEGDQSCASLEASLLTVLEIMGRYVDSDSYVPLLLPRAMGDAATTYSEDGQCASSRDANAKALAAMRRGSSAR